MHGRAGSGASDQAPDAWPSRKRSFRPGPGCMAEQEAELPTRPRMHGRAGSGASDQAPDAWPSRKRSFRPGPGCMAEQEAELPTRPRMHGRAGSGASDQAPDAWPSRKRSFRPGPAARAPHVLLLEFKREPATGTTPLKQLAQEVYTQAEQKYLKGAQEKWNPKEIAIYGVDFRGKALALEEGTGSGHR